MKRNILIILIIGIVTLILAWIGFYLWVASVEKKMFVVPKDQNAVQLPGIVGRKFQDGIPCTIVLLGYGGETHEGTYLTDTIMVVHIDPSAKNVLLFSIPRDLYVNIPTDTADGAYHKINAAYAIGLNDMDYPDKLHEFSGIQGGGRMVEHVVSGIIGQPVDAFVGIDFDGFTGTIDTLGGIDIFVETRLDDPQYPLKAKEADPCDHTEEEIAAYAATASVRVEEDAYKMFPCRYEHLTFYPGAQHMDGATALKYVRSRHSTVNGSDFGRAKRQRSVLMAVRKKMLSIGFVPKIFSILNDLGSSVRTDLTPEDVKIFMRQGQTFSDYAIDLHALTDENYLIYDRSLDGQSILIPKKGLDAYVDIHAWVAGVISRRPPTATPPL